MSLDTTMNFNISGPGGGSSKPSSDLDCPSEYKNPLAPVPSPNDGGGERGRNRVPSVSKPETPDVVSSVFYDPLKGNPGSLDTTLDHVLEISFGK